MTARRVLLVSPREPSGATWLINCLLELGVRIYRNTEAPMWVASGDGWSLSPHEEILKKWLPGLSLRERFHFREGVEVRWTHEWPGPDTCREDVILFVRDPRDALLSRYKREASELTFAEFLAFPDLQSLLDKPDHWLLHLRCWLACESVRVLRFEDYKRDARATLKLALGFLRIEPSSEDFTRAIEASTFEKAAEAERAYKATHPAAQAEDLQLINRKGVPGEWRGLPEYEADMRRIEMRCAGLLRELGYEAAAPQSDDDGFLAHAALLSYFGQVPQALLAAGGPGNAASRIGRTLAFARGATPDLVARSGYLPHQRATLAAGLQEYLRGLGQRVPDTMRAAGLVAPALGWKARIVRRLGLAAR